MKRKNTTRNALFTSIISLLLCVSMLVGTTFAWFTDSVESGRNVIAAGNLDVELEYKKVVDGEWAAWDKVEGASEIFDPNALWEPGHVEVVCLKVSNLGTLALKYQLGVNIVSETPGINVAGEEFNLSDHLVFKVLNYGDKELTTAISREWATAVAGTELGLKDYNGTTTKLEVGGSDYLVLIVYMPETVGNEANYRGDAVPTIELGINLFATQVEAESDSYGDDYDKDAWYNAMKIYTADDLNDALANSQNAVLMNNIDVTEAIVIPKGANATLDLNGYSITGTVGRDENNKRVHTLVNNGTLTLKNGTVASAGDNGGSAINNAAGATLVLENVTILGAPKADGSWPSYGINNYGTMTINGATVKTYHGGIATGGNGVTVINDANVDVGQGTATGITSYPLYTESAASLTVNGGTYANTASDAKNTGGAIACEGGDNAIVINGGNFSGGCGLYGSYVITGGIFDRDVKTYLAEGCSVTEYNGLYYVAGVNTEYVKTSTGVRNALEAGQTAILLTDVSLGNITVEIGTGVEATLDLNGYTLTNNNVAPIKINGGTLTLKDSGENGAVVAGSTSTNNDDKAAILFGENGGKFVMESGTLKSTKYAVRSYSTPSEIVINGGTIEAEYYGVYDNSGSVTMNGGTIIANTANDSYGIAAYGNFIMNGGKITAACAYCSQGTYDDTVAVINGGELIATKYNGIYWPSAGSLTINGGTITGPNAVHVRSGSLSITGGKLTGTGTGDDETALTVENIGGTSGYQAIESVSVTGGTFVSENGSAVVSIPDTTGSNPDAVAVTGFVKGGAYSSNPTAYLAKGYVTVENNGVWTIAMKEHTVSSVDELTAALKEGGKVTLTQDVTVTSKLEITADTVIDGNGATLTYTGSDRAIEIANNADYDVDVTIKNLTVDCSASYCQRGINYNDNGTLTLENVTVKGNVTYGINLPGKSTGATVNIYGGSYSACIPLNIWGANSVVTVNNAEFITVDNSDEEGYACVSLNNDGSISAEGAVITINGGSITVTGSNTNGSYAVRNETLTGKITVSETTVVTGVIEEGFVSVVRYEGTDNLYAHTSLQNSVKCVEELKSGWVVLLTDITVDTLEVNGNVSIDTNGYTLTVGSYTGDGKLTVDGEVVYGN